MTIPALYALVEDSNNFLCNLSLIILSKNGCTACGVLCGFCVQGISSVV
jgi:hypothetical protein